MKATVKDKFLNVRAGKPSVNAPCYQYLAPGSEIEVDGKLYKGDSYEDIDTWMKDPGNNYYWSGGLSYSMPADKNADFAAIMAGALQGQELEQPLDYGLMLNLPDSIRNTKGSGVTIALIDHPLSTSLQSIIPVARPFPSAEPKASYHANFIFGLLAATGDITGIATQSGVVALPIYDENAFPKEQRLKDSFAYLTGLPGPAIVNISNGFLKNYDALINGLSKNKILVVAAGTNEELQAAPLRYPASLSNVITVGSIDEAKKGLTLNKKVDILVPNYSFVSYTKPGSCGSKSGDSFATAIVSAAIALLISSGKTGYDVTSIRKCLQSYAVPRNDATAFQKLNLLNP